MIWKKVSDVLITLNLFENVDKPHPPEEELRVQRRWTHVYLVTLVLILGVLVIFTSLNYQTNTITVDKPTFEFYNNFQQPVECPCTNLSIPYGTFIDLAPSFHDICSSYFIDSNSDWMGMLYLAYSFESFQEGDPTTFQSAALLHFEAIQTMCETATQTVEDELALFLNSTLVSTQMIEFDLFQKQINATLSDFISNSMPSNFLHSLQLIRGMYSGNSFMTAFGTNWFPLIQQKVSGAMIAMQAREYNVSLCNCATSPTCVQEMTLELDSGLLWVVSGMLLGCMPLESMLQSTLECMYNQACLDLISQALLDNGHYPALAANRTRFHPIKTTQLNSIVTELFIEQWSMNVSFEVYFNACQPNTCSYTFSKRFNLLYVINTLLAVYGGLRIVLKFTVPLTVEVGRKFLFKRSRQIAPMNAF